MSNTQTSKPKPTYSALPLIDAITRSIDSEQPPTFTEIAAILGVADRTISRWAAGQRISEKVADHAAIKLGTHPCLIWPEWWANAPAEETEEVA